jgi:hypothetical protein
MINFSLRDIPFHIIKDIIETGIRLIIEEVKKEAVLLRQPLKSICELNI